MSSFTAPLRVEVLSKEASGRVTARLLEAFGYYTDDDPSVTYTVPEGFVTDFASVPRIFWGIAPPLGRYAKAAVIHDYLCVHQHGLTRREVDAMFYHGMRVLNVSRVLAGSMWLAVRVFAILRGKK